MLRSKCFFLKCSKKCGDVAALETVRMIEQDLKINKIKDFYTKALIHEITKELHLDSQEHIIYTGQWTWLSSTQ